MESLVEEEVKLGGRLGETRRNWGILRESCGETRGKVYLVMGKVDMRWVKNILHEDIKSIVQISLDCDGTVLWALKLGWKSANSMKKVLNLFTKRQH